MTKLKHLLTLQSFLRKEKKSHSFPISFFFSRITLNVVPSHVYNRNTLTYPLARLPIAQYWSISCWHFLETFLQFASSDRSPQSLSPLQRSLRFTHLPGLERGCYTQLCGYQRAISMFWAPTLHFQYFRFSILRFDMYHGGNDLYIFSPQRGQSCILESTVRGGY